MASVLNLSSASAAEFRSNGRHRVRLWAQLSQNEVLEGDVVVRDVSLGGFCFEAKRAIALGAPVKLWIGDQPPIEAIVNHVLGDSFGCNFAEPISEVQLAQLLRDGPFAAARPVAKFAETPEPATARWSGVVRALLIIGLSGLGWVGIAALAHFITR
jgi:hypothetical protein